MILVSEILRKFYFKSLQICPPHLRAVATLPLEIQKVIYQNKKVTIFETQCRYPISQSSRSHGCMTGLLVIQKLF